MNSETLSAVLGAKNRRKVLYLLEKEKLTPSQIMKRIGMYESHTSRALKELLNISLIECENPKERRFRFYKITELGKQVAKKTRKILKEIGKE